MDAAPAAVESPADPATTAPPGKARIRLFGQNGVGVSFYENSRCYSVGYFGGGGVSVSGGLGDAFASFAGVASNTSIGMPETPNSANPSSRNGLLSKAYFREYAVNAGEPLTVLMGFASGSVQSGGVYCRSLSVTLAPEAGKDYEASLDLGNGRCRLVFNEIVASAEGTQLRPVPWVGAGPCR